MGKIRVLSVVPYAGLNATIRKAAVEYPEIEVDVLDGNLDSAVEQIQKIGVSQYDAIISRGGTAAAISEHVSIPVIKIGISVYDFMRAIKLSENFSGKKAIVGFPSITQIATKIVDDFSLMQIGIFTIQKREEIDSLYDKLSAEGYRTIIGDVFAYDNIKDLSLNAVLLTSGYESVINAFEETVHLFNSLQYYQKQVKVLQKAFQQIEQKIIVFDSDNNVVFSNMPYSFLKIDEVIQIRGSIPNESSQIRDLNNSSYRVEKWLYYVMDTEFMVLLIDRLRDNELPSGCMQILNYNSPEIENFSKSSLFRSYLQPYSKEVEVVNSYDLPVIITGEHSNGKDALAYLVYSTSKRHLNPFVILDCNIPPDDTFESNMLFLLDITFNQPTTVYIKSLQSVSPETQKSLFDVIQKLIVNNVRLIISSTIPIRHLTEKIPQMDQLIIKHDAHHIHLTSLRENMDRFQELTAICINEANLRYGKQVTGIISAGRKLMEEYSWSGNLIQLHRVINSLVLNSTESVISENAVFRTLKTETISHQPSSVFTNTDMSLEEASMQYIRLVLAEKKNNYSQAAAKLGISRSTLWRKIKNEIPVNNMD